ncbi:MAG: hypothetical protein OES70_06965, partial [Desulfobacterales bacterium]|nr:hypothetical protein [Desulfobacterales bacterium]
LVMDGLMATAEQEVSDPVRVLPHKRFVQAQLGAQIRKRLRGRIDPENNLSRVAGKDKKNREYRNGDKQKQDQ